MGVLGLGGGEYVCVGGGAGGGVAISVKTKSNLL